jgi:hypothetical protein
MKLKKLFKIRRFNIRRKNGKKGQALAIVLTLLLLVSLVVASALTFVGTSLRTNKTYAANTNELYAAEAGIQDGVWQMLNETSDDIDSTVQPVSPNTDPYSTFNYYANNGNNTYNKQWQYQLVDPNNPDPVTSKLFNGYPVTITVKNTWVPLVDYNNPDPSYVPPDGVYTPPAWDIGNPNQVNSILSGNLVISGSVTTIPVYNCKITYSGPNTSSSNSLPILAIGCWLPQGFSYNNGSSNLYHGSTPVFDTERGDAPCAGNKAVVWTFSGNKTLWDLQTLMGQTPGSQTLSINFTYTTALSKLPECLPWVVWGTAAGDFAWDADVTVNDMVAEAGNATDGWTDIEAYVPKSQTRMLGNALSGDYVATGGSNRTDLDLDGQELREHYYTSSSAQVTNIPNTPVGETSVEAAYLYWGGWLRGDADNTLPAQVTKYVDGANNTYFYDASVDLKSSTTNATQTFTIDTSNPDDVYWSDKVKSGRSGTITITSGSKNVTGSGTDFTNTAGSHGVPSGGLTRDQIGVQNTDGTYTWFIVQTVTDDTHLTLANLPPGSTNWTNVPYVVFDGYYYGCKVDVTDFIRDNSQNVNLTANPKVYGDGNATYTVSNVWSDQYCVQDQDHSGGSTETCTATWGGWSLVIVYSNPNTLGHQLYLFDNFKSIANTSGANLTQISGFIVPNPVAGDTGGDAVKLTAFVGEGDKINSGDYFAIRDQTYQSTDNILWDGVQDDSNDTSSGNNWISSTAKDAFNSESINGAISQAGGPYYLNASGVDIDTFHVPWSAGLVQTNDTTATINIYTSGDGLVSIYVIASFRSSVASGGSVSYLIRRKPPGS